MKDGEKGLGRNAGAISASLEIGEILCEGVLLPVTIRGEVPGRAMRGSANLERLPPEAWHVCSCFVPSLMLSIRAWCEFAPTTRPPRRVFCFGAFPHRAPT
ncbi:hypothetical protein EJ066_30710 [Mesorhizobium sp. M9A.F.Ca.ET.002.03.1.2]|nr:hypothetical protein EJ066_30710 [Mesorhizobium sp. M9A.F.Ca.ET.002.03.1.2]